MDSQFTSLKEELQDMRNKYDDLRYYHAFKNCMIDDTPICERHEANYIQSDGCQNQVSHSCQSDYDSNDSGKSLTELNNDVKNDLEDFKRSICSMRTVHSKLYERDDQSKIDLEKTITKFLDGQKVANIKIDELEKTQNIPLEQTDRTDPPPPQAQTEHVNVVFTGSGLSDDSLKTQKDPPPPIIVNNKSKEINLLKHQKGDIVWSKQKNTHFICFVAAHQEPLTECQLHHLSHWRESYFKVLDVPEYRSKSEEESWTYSQGEDDEDNDEHDSENNNDDEDDVQENVSGETESDNDEDDFVHLNLSIYKADDQEEEKANDDEDVSSDQMVSTPPDYEITEEEENQEDDNDVMGGEQEDEELY
ncbi:reverse transcriptase domain-containing protein [Tanacetum coccineum]